ncbi:hypothetical protein U1872_06490 [Sphingomonas sp. RB3P16]|uniref:hypothetical protein n=1 Tax=Parasphingomonas frigoris TaxID=3096163 RepID=UPI002FCBA684
MSRLRDIKRRMRGDLHREMSVPALYIPAPNATPVPCTVRVWRKREHEDIAEGHLQGYAGAAQMVISEDRLRFDLSQGFAPRRLAIVSVAAGEAYRLEFLYPVDLGYQTARVIPLTTDEAVVLPVPL